MDNKHSNTPKAETTVFSLLIPMADEIVPVSCDAHEGFGSWGMVIK